MQMTTTLRPKVYKWDRVGAIWSLGLQGLKGLSGKSFRSNLEGAGGEDKGHILDVCMHR